MEFMLNVPMEFMPNVPMEFMKFLFLTLMLESVVKQACPVFLEETICLVYSDTVIN
jgi:hypothetical protein